MNFLFSSSKPSEQQQQDEPQQQQQQQQDEPGQRQGGLIFPPSSSSSSSSTSLSSSLLVDGTPELWQRRIYSLQSKRCTPAMRQQHQQQQEEKQKRKKRIETSCKSARRLETANYLSSASNMCTLQTYSAPQSMASASKRKEVFKQSAPKSMERAQKIQQSAQRRAIETDNDMNDNDSDEDEDLNELTSELFEDMQATTVAPSGLLSSLGQFRRMDTTERAAATSTMNSELLALLKQLEVEPKEDNELTAKFALFETFLQTVTVIREQTFEFWRENMDLFEGGTKVSAQKEVDKIDSADCMGIFDDSRKWFVYDMTKKANENNGKIAQTLSLLRSRLEQINNMEVGECPFCLEDMTPLKEANQTTMLTCCHRVCTPCWEQWQRVKGCHAFCPLCRNDAFVEEVLSSPLTEGGL